MQKASHIVVQNFANEFELMAMTTLVSRALD